MSKGYEEREEITVNGIGYLIDRDDRTAWICRADTGDAVEYTLPESVLIDGEVFTCCSVEGNAFRDEQSLEVLNIPDTYDYIDGCWSYGCENLHTVHIGAGLESYNQGTFCNFPIREMTISPDNPYLRMSDDGNLILSRDGKTVYDTLRNDSLKELTVPEGVEEIDGGAVSSDIGYLHLPSTLKKIGSNGIFECMNLGHLTIPEGVTEIGFQGLAWLDSLITLELPSTLKRYSSEMLSGNNRMASLVILTDRVLDIDISGDYDPFAYTPVERITLHVPRHLVNDYRNHPQWGRFLAVKAYVPTVFGHHRDIVEEYNRLRDEVRWIDDAETQCRMYSAMSHFKDAARMVKEISQCGEEAKRNLLWNAIRHKESLWSEVKTIIVEHGYDRSWFPERDGKVGLDTFAGIRPSIPPIYDEILLTFDWDEDMEGPIPVRLGDKCALLSPDGLAGQLTGFEYDLIFREPWGKYGNYIAVKDGRCGILNGKGEVVVPCVMDHIYGRDSQDGVTILEKDGLFGLYNDVDYFYPQYRKEDMKIDCDCEVQVRKDGQWGYMDGEGNFTLDICRSCYRNEDDAEK